MPTYDYSCRACGHEMELFQSISESPKRKCPACGTLKLRRLIGSGAGIIFRGSGFYQTDYRTDSYKKDRDSEKKAATDSSDSSSTAGAAKAEKKKPDSGSKE